MSGNAKGGFILLAKTIEIFRHLKNFQGEILTPLDIDQGKQQTRNYMREVIAMDWKFNFDPVNRNPGRLLKLILENLPLKYWNLGSLEKMRK